MQNKYKVYQVDAFTTKKFSGNPASVVSNAAGLTENQMQDIAREMNNSETAFILPSANKNYDIEIRYFTPTTEVPICGHATIAAHYVRASEAKAINSRVIYKTRAGILPADILKIRNGHKIVMTQGKIEFGEIIDGNSKKILMQALQLKKEDLDNRCPIQIVSTGHSKVMIGIKKSEKLNSISPDLQALKELSKNIGCNGYFVFTFDSKDFNILTNGRMFAPAIGINEDPVTGNANGPLGAYIVHHKLVRNNGKEFHFKAKKGEAIRRTGTVDVNVKILNGKPIEVKISGNAVIVFKTEIKL